MLVSKCDALWRCYDLQCCTYSSVIWNDLDTLAFYFINTLVSYLEHSWLPQIIDFLERGLTKKLIPHGVLGFWGFGVLGLGFRV